MRQYLLESGAEQLLLYPEASRGVARIERAAGCVSGNVTTGQRSKPDV